MVTLINKFLVKDDVDTTQFEKVWLETSEFMRAQPGFLGYRFSRSASDPRTYVNIAEWEDSDAHRQVVTSESFREHVTKLGELATAQPEIFVPVFEGSPTA
jgi:long-chain acyl-CoA synthetase